MRPMRLWLSSLHLVSLVLPSFAVPFQEARKYGRDNTDSPVISPPRSPLEWGDINILHTTDTHGWLLGHQKASSPEPNYSADFGDFMSFVTHMKRIADERDVDFLLVDSGDLHDGTGLTDGFPTGGVNAHDSNKFFTQLPYDVLAIGNHELYVYENALDMYTNFAPKYPGRYLTSNVNITVFDDNGNPHSVPLGSRFTKFKTLKGRKITSFGVLFNFKSNAPNTTVQNVEDMIREAWFIDAIQEEPDVFLLVGHMAITKDSGWTTVFNAIRAVHPTTPIVIFGGHTHIRDCVQLDSRSMSLESGRYMETLGWLSLKLDVRGSVGNPTFTRRYLDTNRVTYEFHTGRNGSDFDTPKGKSISQGLQALAKEFDLSFQFGVAPQDYTLARDEYPSPNSVLSLFIEKVVPTALEMNNTRTMVPKMVIVNAGALRFDLHAGPFTRNDQYTVSPFRNVFLYIPDVPRGVVGKVLPTMNEDGAWKRRGLDADGRGYVDEQFRMWLKEMGRGGSGSGGSDEMRGKLTLGYVTRDSCPGAGDDTPHIPLPYFEIPDFIGSLTVPPDMDDGDTDVVDLVFVDFVAEQLVAVLNKVQSEKVYGDRDVEVYSSVVSSEALGIYAGVAWK